MLCNEVILDCVIQRFKRVEKSDQSISIPDELIYLSIHDAVLYAQKNFSTQF